MAQAAGGVEYDDAAAMMHSRQTQIYGHTHIFFGACAGDLAMTSSMVYCSYRSGGCAMEGAVL